MLCSALASVGMGFVGTYWQLILCGFFVGISLAVFSVGVTFVNGWYPPKKQGSALGVYGAGNIGQSVALWGCPFVAAYLSPSWGFWSLALVTILWTAIFAVLARNAPRSGPAKTLGDMLRPLAQKMSWFLSLYYFLTFGGFVAMGLALPKLLQGVFHLTKMDAGLRTAGFVILATLLRPIGGALADRIGGTVILIAVFAGTTIFAIFMACPMMLTFTIGALGMAACIGLGNGAVFKLVPQYFPKSVGAVTGLVGAAGGLGGFFPPLVLGVVKQQTGTYALGFVLLSIFSLICLATCWILKSRTPAAAQ
jgi:NNP family nitrate/nitrite transporter-like MFS transporter